MDNFNIKHHFSDGIYAREMTLQSGNFVMTHKHTYSHFSFLAKGRALVGIGDDKSIYEAGSLIEIKAGQEHYIEAIEDIVWFCVHATSETDESKMDEVLIDGE
jgi:quercetin dioxygenase-like cupin family protein